jgi:hypothetical protein
MRSAAMRNRVQAGGQPDVNSGGTKVDGDKQVTRVEKKRGIQFRQKNVPALFGLISSQNHFK